MINQAHVFSSG
jgi:hypothetical protein